MSTPTRLLGTLIERWRERKNYAAISSRVRAECADELEAALATLPQQDEIETLRRSCRQWSEEAQALARGIRIAAGTMQGNTDINDDLAVLTKIRELSALPTAQPQETKMPWSAHRSHAMQDNGCVRCGTVAREFAITLKCPYDSPVSDIPRRICINKLVPAELKIREAMLAVEDMPADVRLTNAVVLLQQAREKVADFVDGVAASPPAQEQEPK